MSLPFLIIANPISGGGRSRTQAPRLRDALVARGLDAELFFTERGGDARERASRVTKDQYRGVVSVGGDGTLNEVLNGLPDPTIPLGVFAMGTANVLALELNLPTQAEALAEVLAAAHTRSAAIGVAEGRRFLLFASSGLDAHIVQRLEAVRTGTLGKWKWTGPILHTIWRWPIQRRCVTTAEGAVHDDVTTVVVSRVGTYGGHLALPGGIDLGDGMLHVLAFRQRSRWQYFCAVMRALRGRLRVGRDVLHLPTRAVQIAAAPDSAWQVDGDLCGHGDVSISMETSSAQLFAPAPTS